jgi:hypothetical protein
MATKYQMPLPLSRSVPDLTRSAGIQLNEQVCLRRGAIPVSPFALDIVPGRRRDATNSFKLNLNSKCDSVHTPRRSRSINLLKRSTKKGVSMTIESHPPREKLQAAADISSALACQIAELLELREAVREAELAIVCKKPNCKKLPFRPGRLFMQTRW